MGVNWRTGRLYDEDISTADILENLKIELTVWKTGRVGPPEG